MGNRLSKKWLAALIVVAIIGVFAWNRLLREVPQQITGGTEEYFKYGSIGTEAEAGIPYWIWLVLPRIFPEYLPGPGGYPSVGFMVERGEALPIGFSRKVIGFERVAFNCAVCHTSSVRLNPEELPTFYPGGTANTMDSQAYLRFLRQAAEDERFRAKEILDAIQQVTDLSLPDRLLYRFVIIPATRRGLLEQAANYAWMEDNPDWGPGRIDPFNPVKVALLDLEAGGTIGNSDMQPIWNLGPRVRGGHVFHTDGLNDDIREVVLSSALGDGATPKSLPMTELEEIELWLMDLEPPAFPNKENGSEFEIDEDLAAQGRAVFEAECSTCHAFDGERVGTIITQSEVGTDPHRIEMWSQEAAAAYNAYTEGYPWEFESFVWNDGYQAVPLDGIWIRSPYLHNGSVPNLRAMLQPPARRPDKFYRGYDVFDPNDVGFVSDVAEERGRAFFEYDTSLPGNDNGGHEYGTDLGADDKDALVEYMKTL